MQMTPKSAEYSVYHLLTCPDSYHDIIYILFDSPIPALLAYPKNRPHRGTCNGIGIL